MRYLSSDADVTTFRVDNAVAAVLNNVSSICNCPGDLLHYFRSLFVFTVSIYAK